MNKTARHVFRLCVTARNLRKIPCSETWMCYSRAATLPYSSNSNSNSNSNVKDNRLPTALPFLTQEKDFVSEYLSSASTGDEVFQIVKNYHHLMKTKHSLQAFKMLDRMYRLKSIGNPKIIENLEFLQLCEVLSSDIKSLDPNDGVYILKLLSYFKVPATSVITQSLLQLMRTSLNHLTFHNLLDLEHQLRKLGSTPLTDALKIAVPITCEIQVNSNMIDYTNIYQLTDMLLFFCLRPGSNEMVATVIEALRRIGQNMHLQRAKRIFVYMCDLNYLSPGYEEVVLNVQQIIIRGMSTLPFADIRKLLGKVTKKVVHQGDKAFYNEEFVDACSRIIMVKNYGFEDGVAILQLLCKLGHTQMRLIDYLAAKCFENPGVLSNGSPISVMSLVIGLAMTDYKPIFWENMLEMIRANIAKNGYKTNAIVLDFAISMAVFECFDNELIRFVFAQHFLHTIVTDNRPHASWNLLLLYQSVKLLCPTYDGPWPSEYMLNAAIRANGPSVETTSLLPALEKAMGGSQYVLNNLKSKLGHHIDHLVVMRSGGYPVAVNTISDVQKEEPITYIENLTLPAESQAIIVINVPESAYSINSHRLKGHWTLLLKTLEIQTKHSVIPISSKMWNGLMDHEKIPYLMQAIRLKCDSLSQSANAT